MKTMNSKHTTTPHSHPNFEHSLYAKANNGLIRGIAGFAQAHRAFRAMMQENPKWQPKNFVAAYPQWTVRLVQKVANTDPRLLVPGLTRGELRLAECPFETHKALDSGITVIRKQENDFTAEQVLPKDMDDDTVDQAFTGKSIRSIKAQEAYITALLNGGVKNPGQLNQQPTNEESQHFAKLIKGLRAEDTWAKEIWSMIVRYATR